MVKLIGPALGQRASGTLAGQLSFSFAGKSNILRKKPTPKQPRSALQISARAMMTFLTKQWANFTAPQKETWTDAYPAQPHSNYNAYLKYNLERWTTGQPPTQAYPANDINVPAEPNPLSATGAVRHITITVQMKPTINDNWLGLLLHSTSPFADFLPNLLVHVFQLTDLNPHSWTHSPLPTGQHFYALYPAANRGLLAPSWVVRNAAWVT